jgi:hypothetical protein
MRALAQKVTSPDRPPGRPLPQVSRIPPMEGTTENPAIPRPDFSRIPARGATQAARAPDDLPHDFGTPVIYPSWSPLAGWAPRADVPAIGGAEEIVDQPSGGAGGAPSPKAPAPAASDSCGQPTSMDKLTSGAMLGGLTMDSYYPDLVGSGSYSHPGTGGSFDTGSRAGANVQLYGVIAGPCSPTRFHLEQTVTRTRFRIDGAAHAEEGKTFDDLAKSGRDVSQAPFRQDFLGGAGAPLGYIISMADPPSTGYKATSNIEHDRDFVTSVVGPTGRQSVSWSLSTRISKGVVTRNVLT